MSAQPFQPSFEDLPAELAIFPLPGALLLPGSVLPLNIFEPRYLNMTLDALGAGRLIGMIQPRQERDTDALYAVGCAGRIIAFQETTDGRLLINLKGLCRFTISDELDMVGGYRRVEPNWQSFRADLEDDAVSGFDTTALTESAGRYLKANNIECDWRQLQQLSAVELTNFLAMRLPLKPASKQILLEASGVDERAKSLMAITEMSLVEEQPATRH